MFKFNFDVDETDDFVVSGAFAAEKTAPSASTANSRQPREATSKEIPIEDLLPALPPTFSFSPLAIPLTSKRNVVVSRRDLFDARFQVIASDEDTQRTGGRSDLDFLDAPSDLVPGVYEGGLKTWECSLDLVDCLESIYEGQVARHLKGKRVLELGCGTAIPSLYLLQAVFFSEPSPNANIHIHLQDYNDLVLRLVTLPNVILAWYMSPASAAFRASVSTSQDDRMGDLDAEPEPLPVVDTTEPGELPVTPVLTSAFLESLRHYGVQIRFISGSWATFDVERAGGPYQILLTSETIYRTDGLPSLVELMWRATAMPSKPSQGDDTALADSTSRLSLTDKVAALPALANEPYLCLVAAKLVYFGVGGGAKEFIEIVERAGSLSETSRTPRGVVRTVWERIHGVKRSVMQVLWARA
ncbi:hypothetical protein BN946_scf184845.g35 [Trametes cinnabarina]|uniref:protein-histidine N-methyltransferase n=1 Tax=Pycnoporus cinnabarinus TaxID=5643 RepID=A0A060S9Z0_PYCCI|nr:hypothetical protein BN946_scf184845.g35 [Trametes cinnabarina]